MVASPPSGSRTSKASSHGSNGSMGASLYSELAEIPVYTKAEFVKTSNEPPGSKNTCEIETIVPFALFADSEPSQRPASRSCHDSGDGPHPQHKEVACEVCDCCGTILRNARTRSCRCGGLLRISLWITMRSSA